MSSPPFHGLTAAPFTPFKTDGSVDYEKIPAYAKHLADTGVTGAFVNGTTGEGPSLTSGERKKIAETWMASAPESLRIIVHVGHASVEESRDLAAHAESIQPAAIAAFAPFFFKPGNAESLVQSIAHIAAAAPATPFYYYQIPSMTGVSIPCFGFLTTAADRIPTLRGIKYTHEDLMDYLACLNFRDGKYDVVFGRDESLAAALAIGAKGAIGSTYNYLAPIFTRLIAAHQSGDTAAALVHQSEANDIIRIMIQHGGLPAAKAIMSLTGQDLGSVRLPLTTLDSTKTEALAKALETHSI